MENKTEWKKKFTIFGYSWSFQVPRKYELFRKPDLKKRRRKNKSDFGQIQDLYFKKP